MSYKLKTDKASAYLNDEIVISELIKLIKENPCLWNVSENDYKDNQKKIRIWNQIASDLNSFVANKNGIDTLPDLISGKLVQAKFRNLKITYSNIKNKRLLEKDSRSVRWIHFDEIESLLTKIPIRTGIDSILTTTIEKIENETNEAEETNEIIETIEASQKNDNTVLNDTTENSIERDMEEFYNEGPSNKQKIKKRKHEDDYKELIKLKLEKEKESKNLLSIDQSSLTFGKHVSVCLSDLPKEPRSYARSLIIKILHMIELDPYSAEFISISKQF
ncbi:hypothetical protein BLA29_005428 [Euroglyphus maynei]|uniref:MADF domain-containing protein n=1 Tax=Euroglyphus maynei TaxID=6958 RepID=A0A1Y3BQK4_EURMA|nr:hypothetical protein BLA29_005428 [Euroglyphus maynei]